MFAITYVRWSFTRGVNFRGWKILVFSIGGLLQETGSKWKKVPGKSDLSSGIWDCMRAIFSNFHFLLAVHGSPHKWQNESGNYEQELIHKVFLISSRKFQFRFKENARSWAKSIIPQIHEASYTRGCLKLTVLKSLANLRNNQRCPPWSVVQVQDHNCDKRNCNIHCTLTQRGFKSVCAQIQNKLHLLFFSVVSEIYGNFQFLFVQHHVIFWYINNNFEIQAVKLRPHETADIQFLKSHFFKGSACRPHQWICSPKSGLRSGPFTQITTFQLELSKFVWTDRA